MEGKPLLTSKQKTAVVCGVPTQVVCTAFSSHILVVVTQLGKMGTLVSLEPSSVTSDVGKPVLTTKVLLGKDEVMWLGRAPSARTLSGCGASSRQAHPCPPATTAQGSTARAPKIIGGHPPAACSPSAFYQTHAEVLAL